MINYKTIRQNGHAEYTIQRSRFITNTAHAETEAEARAFLQSIKKLHFDARHNCSAWILGADASLQKSHDDGEPGGTAGHPILEVIKQNCLTNSIVVVTRYFGGIKLGAGGLIRAYSHSAVLGLEASGIVEARLFQKVNLCFAYPLLGAIENFLRKKKIRVAEKAYAENVTLSLLLETASAAADLTAINDLAAGNCQIEHLDPEYIEIPL
jgi:uncharacterized YigZ family protein